MHVLLLTLTILSTHDVRLRKQISFLRCQRVGHKLYVSDRMTHGYMPVTTQAMDVVDIDGVGKSGENPNRSCDIWITDTNTDLSVLFGIPKKNTDNLNIDISVWLFLLYTMP